MDATPTPDHARLKLLFDAVCDLTEASSRSTDVTDAATLRSVFDQHNATPSECDAVLVLLEQDRLVNLSRPSSISHSPARPIAAMLATFGAIEKPDVVKPGEVIGAWTVAEKIGEGGMGAVYRAVRSDGQFTQTVAIKFLSGFASPEAHARLTAERKTLAALAHPNIARLVDGGKTDSGQPYIVMDYVDGVTITDYCRTQKSHVDDIASLMVSVCDAVSHAHQNLTLHCDLKPSNILIDQAGHAKLLDFGIAQLLTNDALTNPVDAQLSLLNSHARLTSFTPRYASPEQHQGNTLTTATDVFSLGRVLHELIELAPTQRSLGALGAQQMRNEACAIAERASANRIADRYSSVAELRADLRRLVAIQPVAAVNGGVFYRTQKLMVRRWPMAVALTVLVVGASAFTHSLIRERDRALQAETRAGNELVRAQVAEESARAERDRAQVSELRASHRESEAIASRAVAVSERDRALRAEMQTQIESSRTRNTRDFLFSIFDSADPNRGGAPQMSAADLLTRGKQRVNNLPAAQDEFKTEMLMVLARIHENIGLFNDAKTLYRDAGLRLKQDGKDAGRNRFEQYAQTLDRIAVIENMSNNPAAAEAPAREALALHQQYPHQDANRQALTIANAQNTLGLVLDNLGREEAGNLLRTSLATREKLSKPPSEAVASSLHNLGMHYSRRGNFKDAEKNLQQSLDIKYQLFGKQHPKVLNSTGQLAQVLVGQRRYAEALPILADNYRIRREAHGDTSEFTSVAANEWGSVLHDMGRYDEAILRYRDAIDIAARGQDPKRPLSVHYAICVNNLAGLYEEIGDLARAEEHYRLSMKVRRANLAFDDLSVARIEHNLGRVLLRIGKISEAETLFQQAYQTRLKKRGLAHGETHDTILSLAERAMLDGDMTLVQSLLALLDEKIINQRPSRGLQKLRLDAMLLPATSALTIWQARQTLAEKAFGATHLATLRAKLDAAEVMHQLGLTIEARQLALDVQPRLETVLAANASERLRIALLLGK
jgi:eukaryotic-like serine/threonine-protein kinase